MTTQVIGITGNKRHGKNTLAKFLKEELEAKGLRVKEYAFADAIKEVLCDVLGIDCETLERLKNLELFGEVAVIDNTEYELVGKTTVRAAAQALGQKMKEVLNDDEVWLNIVRDKIKQDVMNGEVDVAIVTDVRFPFEADGLKRLSLDTNGLVYSALIIKVIRTEEGKEVEIKDIHPSETEIKNISEDITVFNSKGLEELREDAKEIVKSLYGTEEIQKKNTKMAEEFSKLVSGSDKITNLETLGEGEVVVIETERRHLKMVFRTVDGEQIVLFDDEVEECR